MDEQSQQPHLSVLLTAHAETLVAGPTLRSAEAAIARVEAAGYAVERMIGFDSPTEECLIYFSNELFNAWDKYYFEFRDQGKTRNALTRKASGTLIALLDGDDLFSENWLVEGIRTIEKAQSHGLKPIVHPELNWIFDAGTSVFTLPSQLDDCFTPYGLYFFNYYDTLCIAPADVWSDFPYPDRAIQDGFAYEDWQWAVETMAARWVHLVAPDTVIFKRRRDMSQIRESTGNSAMIRNLDCMSIDKIRDLGRL